MSTTREHIVREADGREVTDRFIHVDSHRFSIIHTHEITVRKTVEYKLSSMQSDSGSEAMLVVMRSLCSETGVLWDHVTNVCVYYEEDRAKYHGKMEAKRQKMRTDWEQQQARVAYEKTKTDEELRAEAPEKGCWWKGRTPDLYPPEFMMTDEQADDAQETALRSFGVRESIGMAESIKEARRVQLCQDERQHDDVTLEFVQQMLEGRFLRDGRWPDGISVIPLPEVKRDANSWFNMSSMEHNCMNHKNWPYVKCVVKDEEGRAVSGVWILGCVLHAANQQQFEAYWRKQKEDFAAMDLMAIPDHLLPMGMPEAFQLTEYVAARDVSLPDVLLPSEMLSLANRDPNYLPDMTQLTKLEHMDLNTLLESAAQVQQYMKTAATLQYTPDPICKKVEDLRAFESKVNSGVTVEEIRELFRRRIKEQDKKERQREKDRKRKRRNSSSSDEDFDDDVSIYTNLPQHDVDPNIQMARERWGWELCKKPEETEAAWVERVKRKTGFTPDAFFPSKEVKDARIARLEKFYANLGKGTPMPTPY